MITALATVALIAVAYWQLHSLATTSRSDFLFRLKKDFFTNESRQLIFLAENDLLEFEAAPVAHFRITGRDNPQIAERMEELHIKGKSIRTYAVDDALLGPLEDMGVLESMGLLSLKEIYEAFVTYVNICVESKPLAEYLKFCRRDEEDDDVYDHLLLLHKKLKRQTPKIREAKRSVKS